MDGRDFLIETGQRFGRCFPQHDAHYLSMVDDGAETKAIYCCLAFRARVIRLLNTPPDGSEVVSTEIKP